MLKGLIIPAMLLVLNYNLGLKVAGHRQFYLFVWSNIRVVTKILSYRINITSRWGMKKLGISFGSIFLLFSNESGCRPHS